MRVPSSARDIAFSGEVEAGPPQIMCQTNNAFAPVELVRRNSFTLRKEALAAGGLVAGAELARLLRRGERPHHGPVDNPFAAQVGTANDGLPVAELIGELGLQAAERGLRLTLALLRRELHDEAARGASRLGRGPRRWRQRRRAGRCRCR